MEKWKTLHGKEILIKHDDKNQDEFIYLIYYEIYEKIT